MSRSTEKKAVFFDADGTLCDMEKGVPDSTKEALKKLRENGHEAWLCTGRSRAFVSWYLEELPFTGMISACGATIEKDGKRLFNKEMTPEIAKLSVEILRKYGLIPVMEGAEDFNEEEDSYEVLTAPDDFSAVREAIENAGAPIAEAQVAMIPQTYVDLTDEQALKDLQRTLDLLDEDDDVTDVWTNWNE